MDWSFDELLRLFDNKCVAYFKESKHGVEKECLRVDSKGSLSQKPHPESLGSPLFHPNIKTDFSESQLELITPTFSSEEEVLRFLTKLHGFVYQNLKKELLWPYSMPGVLPKEKEIPLAAYGSSDLGIEKHIYRKGLSLRYGRKMQTVSGVHYNFSLSSQLLDFLYANYGGNLERTVFVSEVYLKIVRNFLRMGWAYTYLFGATPAADKTLFPGAVPPLKLLDPHTLYAPAATSLRMSHLGYYSKTQRQKPISFNSLEEYIGDLSHAVSTPYPPYTKLGLDQLNDHLLQMEAEHYSRIRPKPRIVGHERPLLSLRREGIQYVEVRSLDNDPFSCVGVQLEQLQFLHLFLVYCLFEPSPPLDAKENKILTENQNKVALFGRNPRLKLKRNGATSPLKSWVLDILEQMKPIAALLDRAFQSDKYTACLNRQKEKAAHPELLLSQRIMDELVQEKISLREFGCRIGKKCKRLLQEKAFNKKMSLLALRSLEEQELIEIEDDSCLRGYETLESSTGALIREAKNRGIGVEVLDWNENLIRLTKGKKVEVVKQATKTSKDSLISYFLMENKQVTKQILAEHGLPVPAGNCYSDVDEALKDYQLFSERSIVVKPNTTNYGVGISFIQPRDEKSYQEALRVAFAQGTEVIVEEFCEGAEYRFLVVGGKVVAVCQRVAANVVGDGVHTISQLIKIKNRNPRAFRRFSPIKLGAIEKQILAESGLAPDSILKNGERQFLRKNSNVSTGGESIDFTDAGHGSYRTLACKAAKAVNAAICGVDMIIKDIYKPGDGVILELNFNPALYLHRYPVEGQKRYVERDILDFLGY